MHGIGAGTVDDTAAFLGEFLTRSVYVFRAERLNIAQAGLTSEAELRTDAGNLASVLMQLPTNPSAEERFRGHLRTVFPSIYDVVSHPIDSSQARVEVINRDCSEGAEWRPGVTVPLTDSGTGVSQVLAILYVAVTATWPRIIVIDEPNSFLHPGAAKKLIEILKGFDHQYIITTHSSEIVRTVDPDFLHLVKWDGRASAVESLDSRSRLDLQRLLDELGVRISDLFGSDNVLWVEGETEEKCFPLLLRHQGLSLSPATAVVAVSSPGELVGAARKRSEMAFRVYERLSQGSALVPPALAFSFDREGRTEKDIEELTRRSKGLAHFLNRRAYENYLIDIDAIAAVLSDELSLDKRVLSEKIREWIELNGRNGKYIDTNIPDGIDTAEWLRRSDAPRLLNDMFAAISSATIAYRKTVHSVALTQWLLLNKPESLSELLKYVRDLVLYSRRVVVRDACVTSPA